MYLYHQLASSRHRHPLPPGVLLSALRRHSDNKAIPPAFAFGSLHTFISRNALLQRRARVCIFRAIAQVRAACNRHLLHHGDPPRCISDASLNCVCCYWGEALIAQGNVSKACDVMQEAVQRRTACAAADADVNVTLACTLAVAGFSPIRTIYSSSAQSISPALTLQPCRALLARQSGSRRELGGGAAGLRCAVSRLHIDEVSCGACAANDGAAALVLRMMRCCWRG